MARLATTAAFSCAAAASSLTPWFMECSKGKQIRKNITVNLRGHRDVGGYRIREGGCTAGAGQVIEIVK